MMSNRITKAQVARIWATAHQLGMDHDLLYTLVPRGSISHMTRAEASQLIEALNALARQPAGAPLPQTPGWRRQSCLRRTAAPTDAASEEQQHMIHALFEDLGWLDNPRRVEGFLRKYAHVGAIDEIPSRKRASAIIEALKAIRARQARDPASASGPRPGTSMRPRPRLRRATADKR